MFRPLALPILLLSLVVLDARGEDSTDDAAIRQAVLDYIEGWYEGDTARMSRAVHPDLIKRVVMDGRLRGMTAAELIEATRRYAGRNTPKERRRAEVDVLDILGASATVKLTASEWVDYVHLAKLDGEWRIINVLWEPQAPRSK